MDSELSILIPVRNDVCLGMVERLHQQAGGIRGLDYEVIVLDDGSTDEACIRQNQAIGALAHCRFVRQQRNAGRSATRNRLARMAGKEHLLFLDSNQLMPSPSFVLDYVNHCGKADVVCGGTVVDDSRDGNLRHRYEWEAMGRLTARKRQRHPYQHFRSNNFLIRRQTLLAHPFHDEIKLYGFEDVLLGKELSQCGASVLHIDNPVAIGQFETNSLFLSKTEESLRTLRSLEEELAGFSTLLRYAWQLRRLHADAPMREAFGKRRGAWRQRLIDDGGPLWLLKLYKLGYYLSLANHPPIIKPSTI